jgi:hypothetical protein
MRETVHWLIRPGQQRGHSDHVQLPHWVSGRCGTKDGADVCEAVVEDQLQVLLVAGKGEHLQEVLLAEAQREVEHAVVRQPPGRDLHIALNINIHTHFHKSPSQSSQDQEHPQKIPCTPTPSHSFEALPDISSIPHICQAIVMRDIRF